MKPCADLRDFIALLEERNELKRIHHPVSPHLEITEISRRVLASGGPALLFARPVRADGSRYEFPLLANLFGTSTRVALALGAENTGKLRDIGRLLANLKEPEPPQDFIDALGRLTMARDVWHMAPHLVESPPCQSHIIEKDDIDIGLLPIQQGWPEDIAPLISWGLVITRNPHNRRENVAIYRQQPIGKNKVIMRWLAHRGGALDYQAHQQLNPGQPFPVAVAIGCDPATLLAAVTPIPDTLGEYQFAGLLRGARSEVARCIGNDLHVPARAEIVFEGYIYPGETALEGPYGDHTGYYNSQAHFPVLTIERLTLRNSPVYHSTYLGKPPDEPAILASALNEVFIPLLQKQFPEITDFYLPAEGCSYRFAVVAIRKQYTGHARRIMMGIWSSLRQFTYTKYLIIVDDDIDCRDWKEVIWAVATRADPVRDCMLVERTAIDYLDFASPISGLGGKMGIDATHKWPEETRREWGKPIRPDPATVTKIDNIWQELGL
ncbi:MAG: UbiD family decarboxylase [Cardiobacteriaceae bacterium]|nr:UbiD family decarboxylase [Cardiobacteriaceae bacterium]